MRIADIGTGHHQHFGVGKTRVDTFVAQHALKIAGACVNAPCALRTRVQPAVALRRTA